MDTHLLYRILASRTSTVLFLTMVFLLSPPLAEAAEVTEKYESEYLAAENRLDESPRLERISFTQRADGNGVVMRLHLNSALAAHSVPAYREDGSIEITLFRTSIYKRRVLDIPDGLIRSYRVDEKNRDVVIRLEPSSFPITASAYRDRDSNDLLISLSSSPPVRSVTQVVPTPTAVGSASSELPRPTADADGARWTLDTIVIDAGHGGKDHGAVSRDGTREKDVVLNVALMLGSYLRENLGLNVVYTRSDDRFIPLENRGHIANQAGGKLFVSIHANSATDRRAKGTETFFLGMHKTDAAQRVMERENEVIQFEENQDVYVEYDAMNSVMQALAQSSYMRQSQFLAQSVEEQFENRAGRNSRGVKQAGFYVLYGASMPSILVELGFLSNPSEAAFMRSEDGQAYLASAIFRAIRDYKSEYDRGLHLSVSND